MESYFTSGMPLLSIIIPHYNGTRILLACLAALRRQTYPYLEVILVDNGSTDPSLPLTRQHFPEVKIIETGLNLGYAGAVNQGIRFAAGEIIVALNNDTEADPGWAQALVEVLQTHPEAGLVASKMRLYHQRDRLHSAGDSFGSDGIPINRGVWQQDEGQFDQDVYIFGGCGGAVAYRRRMLAEIGLFDEEYFMYLEDVDLNWRAQLAGYRAVFAPQAVVYHHLSASGGGVTASYYTGRNTIWMLAKVFPGFLFRRYWSVIVRAQLKIAGEALRAWRGQAARARLRGQLAGLLGLPKWLRKRQKIRRSYRVSDAYLEGLLTHTSL
ncbi:MAG TPA: glycosyltransferase family 2 protein [Anaerolineae bacterium]|nr:glycosyltransferase family 2 protein [Anaerolineae bacterium]